MTEAGLPLPQLLVILGLLSPNFADEKRLAPDPTQVENGHRFSRALSALSEIRAEFPHCQFLLESLPMRKDWMDEVSKLLGSAPVLADAAEKAVIHRKRIWWTSWDLEAYASLTPGDPQDI